MNKIQVLMEKPGLGEMNVPAEKLSQYLEDGWIEKSRAPMGGFDPDLPGQSAIETTGEAAENTPKPETTAQKKAREKAERKAAADAQKKSSESDEGQESESQSGEGAE